MPAPIPPQIPTGQELYDALMAHIEPELTTEGAKSLAAKYQNESPVDRAARKKKYELAFERCQKSYDEYMATLHTQVGRYRRDAFRHAEVEDRSHDSTMLDAIGNYFLKAA